MTEIWVPYGPVEVSFDIKQENLSEIVEPQPQKVDQEELERTVDMVNEETVVLLSSTTSVQKVLDTLLARNKVVRKILHPKNLAALARRKSQEFGLTAEQLNPDSLADIGSVESTHGKLPRQVANTKGQLLMKSVHYDPLFGLASAASELLSLVPETKTEAFKLSIDELPCDIAKSSASTFATRLLQATGDAKVLEIAEKSSTGIVGLAYGEQESVHQKMTEFWAASLKVQTAKSERVLFGCGGNENDKTLHEALSRSFFNIVKNFVLPDSESKVCMLAECSQGLGSEALLRFVTGRYEPRSKLDEVSYFDGLEVLLSFFRVQNDLELTILSTLPHYYASKFDFKTIRGAKEAPSALVQQGSRAKILVIPDGTTTHNFNE